MAETMRQEPEVLLVREKSDEQLKAVKNITEDGKLTTVAAKPENQSAFMKIDKGVTALENLISNFARQVENPSHFRFFKVPLAKLDEWLNRLSEAFKNPKTPENKELLNARQVKTYAIDPDKVDWKQLERLGVSRNDLEQNGQLDKLLNWQKTSLLPVSMKFDDSAIHTDARLSLRETSGGKLSVSIHALRNKPDLDAPFMGARFSGQDKENLRKTGNLGRTIEVESTPGEKIKMFVSLDNQTNELVAVRADKLRLETLHEVKGKVLTPEQKQQIADGKAVWVEGMTSVKDTPFNAFVQISADKRSIEFRFDNFNQGQTESKELRIPDSLLGVKLSDRQKELLQSGEPIHLQGLRKGEREFDSYVRANYDKNKLEFSKYKPATPAQSGKQQTKQPDEKPKQAAKKETKTAVKEKSKGRKM